MTKDKTFKALSDELHIMSLFFYRLSN